MIYYIDKNKLEYFTFGGTSSASFNFIIVENDNLKGFENDFELISIPGRSGDLIVDNQRKKNKEINIVAYVDLDDLNKDAKTTAKEIKTWLQSEVKYKDLIFSDDLTYKVSGISAFFIQYSKSAIGRLIGLCLNL